MNVEIVGYKILSDNELDFNLKDLAADESTTMEVIFPSLNWNPMCPVESWK